MNMNSYPCMVVKFKRSNWSWSAICWCLVCTAGAEGAYIASGGETIHVSANPVNVVDATGAGDLFAAGFLAGLSQNKDLEVCGKMGCVAAAEVISSMGARPKNNLQDLFDINKL